MLKEIEIIVQTKIYDQERKSLQHLGYPENILLALSLKHFKNICFLLTIKIMLCYFKFHFKQQLCGE